jgi:hypothetical protein
LSGALDSESFLLGVLLWLSHASFMTLTLLYISSNSPLFSLKGKSLASRSLAKCSCSRLLSTF